MSQDREKLRRRREKQLGRKRPKREPSWKYIASASVLIVIFAVALIVFVKLISLVPGSNAISPLVTLGLPLALSWLVAAVGGRNLVSGKQSLAIATICLVVASPLAYYKPWERGGGWTLDNGTIPENVPPGYVAFRFTSSFTYVSSEGNQPITDVELWLAWPYIDDYENGRPCPKPVGLDNWLHKKSLTISMVQDENINRYVREVWKIENTGQSGYTLENAAWCVDLSLPGLPYTQVNFEPALELYYNDRLEWKDNQTIELLGGRTATPAITAHLEDWGNYAVFQKITVRLSNMNLGETVSIEGTFLVAEENASKVRLDDWIASGIDRVYWKPNQENAPYISVHFAPGSPINNSATSLLEKFVNGSFSLVVKYEESWQNIGVGGGFIDGIISRG